MAFLTHIMFSVLNIKCTQKDQAITRLFFKDPLVTVAMIMITFKKVQACQGSLNLSQMAKVGTLMLSTMNID